MENEQEPKKSNRKPREPRKPRAPRKYVSGGCLSTMVYIDGGVSNVYRAYYDNKRSYVQDYMRRTDSEWVHNAEKYASQRLGWSSVYWGGHHFVFDMVWRTHLCAIEMVTPENDDIFDEVRDRYLYARSGILVFRVKFGDIERLQAVVAEIGAMGPDSGRRPVEGLYRDCHKVVDAWSRVRRYLDPRRAGWVAPPVMSRATIAERSLTFGH
jgi:hypothetical protein